MQPRGNISGIITEAQSQSLHYDSLSDTGKTHIPPISLSYGSMRLELRLRTTFVTISMNFLEGPEGSQYKRCLEG